MEMMLYVAGLMLLIGLGFILVEKPYYLVAFLLFMQIYILNIKIPGPLDARGLLLLVLFVRLVFFDKENSVAVKTILFRNLFFYLVLTFIILAFIVTYSNAESLKVPLKDLILSIFSLIMGFIIISNKKGRNAFTYGLLAAGLVSVFDLIFHYAMGGFMADQLFIKGELAIVRLLDFLTTDDWQWGSNHNFPGYLAGTAFIYVYLKQYKKNWKKIFTLPLLILLGAGVFLSTSRSTILSVIIVLFFISFSHGNLSFNLKKIITVTVSMIFLYASFYFSYNLFLKSNSKDKDLIRVVYFRLYEEPFQILGSGSKEFDIYTGESRETSTSFRWEKVSSDVNRFFTKDVVTQVFGYGKGGYKYFGQRIFQDYDKSYVLDPHNGYILILVEKGILGLFIFFIFSIGLIIKSVMINNWKPLYFPVFYLFLMLMIYVIGQNGELTDSFSFLLIGGMIANVAVLQAEEEELEEFFEKREPNLV
jgi:hypothetical protein